MWSFLYANAAQAQQGLVNPTVTTSRALIRSNYTNTGVAGGAVGNVYSTGLSYPNNGSGVGNSGATPTLGAYGSVLGGANFYYVAYSASRGESTWVLTSDGQVTLTGPRSSPWVGRFIRPVPYDPKGRPEETWGVPNPIRGLWKGGGVIAGNIPSLATYWPGITNLDEGSLYAASLRELTPPAQIANYRLGGYLVNPDLPEEVIIAQWTNVKQGITTQARVCDWSNPDFDDFLIVEYLFTNTGDFDGDGQEDRPGQTKVQASVYFAFVNREQPTVLGTDWYRQSAYFNQTILDDITFYSDAAGYRGAFPKGLRASIWRDSDDPVTSWDDTGDPFYLRESLPDPGNDMGGNSGGGEHRADRGATAGRGHLGDGASRLPERRPLPRLQPEGPAHGIRGPHRGAAPRG